MRLGRVVVGVLASAILATTTVAAVPAVQRTAGGALAPPIRGESYTTRPAPLHITLISDSAFASIRWKGLTWRLDPSLRWDTRLESCRRVREPSCRGREGYRPATLVVELQRIAAAGGVPNGSLLLIEVGYNDWETNFRADIDAALAAARAAGFERIGWLNYRENVSYKLPPSSQALFANYAVMNQHLAAAALSGRWPELAVLDYNTFSAQRPDWYGTDGVHLNFAGTNAIIDWLNSIVYYSATPAFAPDNWRPA